MRRYVVRYTPETEADLLRLYAFLLEHDLELAGEALNAIREATQFLRTFPYACRRVPGQSPRLRELLIPFGDSGYVVLFEIEPPRYVTILAARHQREDDYH